tara:strand:- start:299 stop:574 length:276 start_codon:yes stop_codon:yes gene_type:complete
MQRIVGADPEAELRKVGPANEDGTRSPKPFNQRSVRWGDELSEGRKALGGGCAGYINVFLDRARHTMEGADSVTSRYSGVSLDRAGSSLLG